MLFYNGKYTTWAISSGRPISFVIIQYREHWWRKPSGHRYFISRPWWDICFLALMYYCDFLYIYANVVPPTMTKIFKAIFAVSTIEGSPLWQRPVTHYGFIYLYYISISINSTLIILSFESTAVTMKMSHTPSGSFYMSYLEIGRCHRLWWKTAIY